MSNSDDKQPGEPEGSAVLLPRTRTMPGFASGSSNLSPTSCDAPCSAASARCSRRRRPFASSPSEVSLPKDVVNFLLHQATNSKDEVLRVVGKEVRSFLESANLSAEMAKMLTQLSLEVKTEVRFIPERRGRRRREARREAEDVAEAKRRKDRVARDAAPLSRMLRERGLERAPTLSAGPLPTDAREVSRERDAQHDLPSPHRALHLVDEAHGAQPADSGSGSTR